MMERKYNIYWKLGLKKENKNARQALLCYKNSLFHLEGDEKDYVQKDPDAVIFKEKLKEKIIDLQQNKKIYLPKTAIVILSYNTLKMTQECIDSIEENNEKESFEIIIIDNASTDGSAEWLGKQTSLKVRLNSENAGFPMGCNQGIELAEAESDIFLLNSDTLLTPDALFWLRMGLYENEKIGATGSITNYASNYQNVGEMDITNKTYMKYAEKYNVPMERPYEKKSWLVGFALLLKRTVLEEIGYLDTRYTPGNFEDNDLGLRIGQAGYEQLLCLNSFIFHYGSKSFGRKQEKFPNLLEINEQKFMEKWGIHPSRYHYIRTELIQMLPEDKMKKMRVLEIGCGCGATLARIQRLYPNATVHGVEKNEKAAYIAGTVADVYLDDIETMDINAFQEPYDYILMGGVLESTIHPETILRKVSPLLASGGKMFVSVYNAMHISVIAPLLQGELQYTTEGILDEKHVRLFTAESALTLFEKTRYKAVKLSYTTSKQTKKEDEYINKLMQVVDSSKAVHLQAYQYVFTLQV